MSTPYILVLYFSRYGHTRQMAELIARGVEMHGKLEAKLRTVAPLDSAPDDNNDAPAIATLDDLSNCSGLVLGSPTRFGNMAGAMKHFWDGTSGLWMQGALDKKPASVFTSTASMHGGQESTLLTMMMPLMHHGMLMVGSSYTYPELAETISGGTPYGPSHRAGGQGEIPITNTEKQLCICQGQRIADIAWKLLND